MPTAFSGLCLLDVTDVIYLRHFKNETHQIFFIIYHKLLIINKLYIV